MQKLKLIMYNDNIHRVLAEYEERTLLIDCIHFTMPKWVATIDLQKCCECTEEELLFNDSNVGSLSTQKKKLAHERYTLIASILPFVSNEYMRSRKIAQVSESTNISKQTIRKYLCRFLAYQTIDCLVPAETGSEKPLSIEQKNFRWAINKFYYSPLKHTLRGTYLMMLKERYTTENGDLTSDYPPFHRFKYFFNKTKNMQSYYISRDGLTNYQRNQRPLLGEGVREFASSIGMGMLDSTILDIYLINDEQQVVGRPILTACVDAYSGLCCGYSLSWEGGTYSLQCLLKNIVANKVEHCKRFGVHIHPEDWNCNSLPATFVTDKGKEYTSYALEQITDLGVTIINLPPYRPDLKSYVEQFFNIIQNLYKPILKGKGVIEKDFVERGAIDYRKTACLTIEEFEIILLKCIIHYNTKRRVESFFYTEEMINSNIKPFSNHIWNFSLDASGANLIDIDEKLLHLTLLPRSKARFSRRGLLFSKLRYHSEGFTERYLKSDTCVVSYDPTNTSRIWLFENGEYTEFALIDSIYGERTFEETKAQIEQQNIFLKSYDQECTQAKLDLIEDIEAIAKHSNIHSKIEVSSIRKTRNKERDRRRIGT